MKTIEEIEKEYQTYEIKTVESAKSLDEFMVYLRSAILDTCDAMTTAIKEIRTNKKIKIVASILNVFLFRDEDTQIFDDDNKIVQEEYDLSLTYKGYFESLEDIVTEENYRELLRLADFSVEYYNDHVSYLEVKRDKIDTSDKSYNVHDYRYSDNRKVFDEFFCKKLEEISITKGVEKVKKM